MGIDDFDGITPPIFNRVRWSSVLFPVNFMISPRVGVSATLK